MFDNVKTVKLKRRLKMSFLELAKRRYSVRSYEERAVEREKLMQVLEAGRVAPTAANGQPQKLLVIESKEGLEKLEKGAKRFGAPCAIIVCGDKEKVWVRNYDGHNTIEVDASIVTDHMMLAATDLGLATLWMTWFDPAVIRKEFDLPDNLVPVNILLVGYGKGPVASPERHSEARAPLDQTVFFESL